MAKLNLAGRAGRWSAHNWKKACFGWLIIAVSAMVLGGVFGTRTMSDDQAASGETATAQNMLVKGGLVAPPVENLLIQSPKFKTRDPQFRSATKALLVRVERVQGVSHVLSPSHGGAVSKDGHSLLLEVQFTEVSANQNVSALERAVASVAARHLQLGFYEYGPLSSSREMNQAVSQDFQHAEVYSIPITLFIMLFVFGALMAAGIPVLLAFSAVLLALGLNALISHGLSATTSAAMLVLLIGMAVGVDYSLFYLRREREERALGLSPLRALLKSAATSGQAVLVSGITVLVAMAGMLFAGSQVFQSMGLAMMIVVAAAIVGSLTVLPAILARLGDHIDRGRIPFLHARLHRPGESRVWKAILRPVLAHPLIAAILATGFLLALASPALDMHTALPGVSSLPPQFATAKAYRQIQDAFPGAQTPASVVVSGENLATPRVAQAISALRRQALASGQMLPPIDVHYNSSATAAVINVPLVGDGNNSASQAALHTLRTRVIPATLGLLPGVSAATTGQTAGTADFNSALASRLPYIFAFVLGLAFILLLVTFRSLIVPLKAIALNMLSVAASYGILVAAFQWGWMSSILGFQPNGTIISWLPMFLFVVLFGLSMDYHVFILSRVKELVDRGETTERAVSHSIVATAGTVSAAACVMVAVFAIFTSLRLIEIKEAGFALAVAIFLDATVIRGVLLPSAMKLLGEWNWYLPRWLRWLPRMRFSQPSLSEAQ